MSFARVRTALLRRNFSLRSGLGVPVSSAFEIRPEHLPLTLDFSPDRRGARTYLVFGIAWLVFSASAATGSFASGRLFQYLPDFLLAGLFGGIGLILLFSGYWLLNMRHLVRYEPDGVYITYRNPFGRDIDRFLAYGQFEGVLLYQNLIGRRDNVGDDPLHQYVVLHHADERLSVPLLKCAGDTPPRDAWKRMARHYDLPALEIDGDRLIGLAGEDLELTLRERTERDIFEGRRPDVLSAPPATFDVWNEGVGLGEKLHVRINRSRIVPGVVAVFLAIPVAALIAPLLDPRVPALLPLFGAGFAILVAWIAITERAERRELVISRRVLRIVDALPQARPVDRCEDMQLTDVERVGCNGGDFVVFGRKGRLFVGPGLSPQEAAWLKAYIEAAIAGA